ISPDADAIEAAQRLVVDRVGCLPVVDERHRLLGILTELDFVRILRDQLEAVALATPTPARSQRGSATTAMRGPALTKTSPAPRTSPWRTYAPSSGKRTVKRSTRSSK